jgi:DNA-binding GntR family transcriptional regulator
MLETGLTHQQRAYDHVKLKIMNLTYKPGEIITDNWVARELGISRTPVRASFYRLENEGLLLYEPRRGWRVYSLTLEDIEEIFTVKIAVEGATARKAAECEDEELRAELASALEEMRVAVEADSIEAWVSADTQFHEIIFSMAHNERARRIIIKLNDQWHRVRIGFDAMQGRIKEALIEHEAIANGILNRQPDEAEETIREHLEFVRAALVDLLINIVLPFASDGI